MLKKSKESKGFTLIEVVIVLAIAALIILVVLQAVGAAQKANRDTTRKNEAARMVSLLEQYASNNGGKYPADATAFTNALGLYDTNFSGKYTVISGAAVAPAPSACPATISSSTFNVVYSTTSATYRDYVLNECLEAGGSVTVTH
ncbi:MAG: type II secretion system protein [Candidatus Saccharibacteria bacterium]